MDQELTPENRRAVCERIGSELGLDPDLINNCIAVNTVAGLNSFKDAFIKARHDEEARRSRYTPRASVDGLKPDRPIDARNNSEKFSEWLSDVGFY